MAHANQFSPRAAGSLVHVTFDFRHGRAVTLGIAGDMRRADKSIRAAHMELATQLQNRQAKAFVYAVSAHGRAQRTDITSGPMYKAILSDKNRTVNVNGFTVGYLDDPAKFPHVSKYAAGLESGTAKHKGQVMAGLWITPKGFAGPIEGALDAIGYKPRRQLRRSDAARARGWVITKAIEGYGFQRAGYNLWVEAGFGRSGARDAYVKHFDRGGLNFAARLFSRTGKRFTVSQISTDITK